MYNIGTVVVVVILLYRLKDMYFVKYVGRDFYGTKNDIYACLDH